MRLTDRRAQQRVAAARTAGVLRGPGVKAWALDGAMPLLKRLPAVQRQLDKASESVTLTLTL